MLMQESVALHQLSNLLSKPSNHCSTGNLSHGMNLSKIITNIFDFSIGIFLGMLMQRFIAFHQLNSLLSEPSNHFTGCTINLVKQRFLLDYLCKRLLLFSAFQLNFHLANNPCQALFLKTSQFTPDLEQNKPSNTPS